MEVRIFLVDDHRIVKYGIKSLLEKIPKYVVVGEAESAEDFLSQLWKFEIDLLISDISLSGIDGIALTRQVKELSGNKIKVLIVSMHGDYERIKQCFEAGADGYLLKDFDGNELLTAVDKVMMGEIYASNTVSAVLASNHIHQEFLNKKVPPVKDEITKREKEIIELISAGLSNKEIATRINLSTNTIDVHRFNIFKKLEVRNTAELIMKAIKLKIIDIK